MKMDIAPLLTDSANIAEVFLRDSAALAVLMRVFVLCVQIEMDEGATAVAEKEAEEAGAGGEHLDGEQSQVGGSFEAYIRFPMFDMY